MQQATHTSNSSLKYICDLRRVHGDGSGLWSLDLAIADDAELAIEYPARWSTYDIDTVRG